MLKVERERGGRSNAHTHTTGSWWSGRGGGGGKQRPAGKAAERGAGEARGGNARTSSAFSINGFAPPSTDDVEASSNAERFLALSLPSNATSSADSRSPRVAKSGICSAVRILSLVWPGMSFTESWPETLPPRLQLP